MSYGKNLSMFFDSEFDPNSYVDALFQSLLTPNATATPASTYTSQSLNSVSKKVLDLVTHLEYYTTELSQDLSQQISRLQHSSSPVAANENITRLQYYVNAFNNSILALEEVKKVGTDPETNTSSPVAILIKLKVVRGDLLNVLTFLEKSAIAVSDENPDTSAISVESFQHSVNVVYDTLRKGLEESPDQTLESVDDMVSLLPLFQRFTNFYPIYKKFVNRISAEADRVRS